MKIAVCQVRSHFDVEKNTETVCRIVDEEKADLYLFPELFLSGYGNTDITANGMKDAIGTISISCGNHGCAVAVGTPRFDGEVLRNSLAFVTPGKTTFYDKIHTANFGPYDESAYAPGNEPVMVEWAGMRFGLLICYDLLFPELCRYYAAHGADAVLMASASAESSERTMRTMLPARSLENTMYTVFCNNIGPGASGRFFGGSSVYSPLGEPMATTNDDERILVAKIDKETVISARRDRPHLRDRRNDIDWSARRARIVPDIVSSFGVYGVLAAKRPPDIV